ncbi:hypothetical protein NPIL_1611, partial [Nephila pilipes]
HYLENILHREGQGQTNRRYVTRRYTDDCNKAKDNGIRLRNILLMLAWTRLLGRERI